MTIQTVVYIERKPPFSSVICLIERVADWTVVMEDIARATGRVRICVEVY